MAQYSPRMVRFILGVDRFALDLAQHWLVYFNFFFGILIITPFLAPPLMAMGLTGPASAIYGFYGLLCHQLPERSFFLLGHKVSYSLTEISRAYPYDSIFQLREFIGNEAMGWKVAWSDRMVSLYGSLWFGGLIYGAFRRRLPRISPLAWLLLAIVPMGVDGGSHMLNDALAGMSGTGFRDTNAWLAFLTGSLLPANFYAGDALGSFNNLARLITGALTGLTSMWIVLPFVGKAMRDVEAVTLKRLNSPRAAELGYTEAQ